MKPMTANQDRGRRSRVTAGLRLLRPRSAKQCHVEVGEVGQPVTATQDKGRRSRVPAGLRLLRPQSAKQCHVEVEEKGVRAHAERM